MDEFELVADALHEAVASPKSTVIYESLLGDEREISCQTAYDAGFVEGFLNPETYNVTIPVDQLSTVVQDCFLADASPPSFQAFLAGYYDGEIYSQMPPTDTISPWTRFRSDRANSQN